MAKRHVSPDQLGEVDGHALGGPRKAQETNGLGALMSPDGEELEAGPEFNYGKSTAQIRAERKAQQEPADLESTANPVGHERQGDGTIKPHREVDTLEGLTPQELIGLYLLNPDFHLITKAGDGPPRIVKEEGFTLMLVSGAFMADFAAELDQLISRIVNEGRFGHQWEDLKRLPTIGTLLDMMG